MTFSTTLVPAPAPGQRLDPARLAQAIQGNGISAANGRFGIDRHGQVICYRGAAFRLHPQQVARARHLMQRLDPHTQLDSPRLDDLMNLARKLEVPAKPPGLLQRLQSAARPVPPWPNSPLSRHGQPKPPLPPKPPGLGRAAPSAQPQGRSPLPSPPLSASVSYSPDPSPMYRPIGQASSCPPTPDAGSSGTRGESLFSRMASTFRSIRSTRSGRASADPLAHATAATLKKLGKDVPFADACSRHLLGFGERLAQATEIERSGVSRVPLEKAVQIQMYQDLASGKRAPATLDLHQSWNLARWVMSPARMTIGQASGRSAEDLYNAQQALICEKYPSEASRRAAVGAFKAVAAGQHFVSGSEDPTFNKITVNMQAAMTMFEIVTLDKSELNEIYRKTGEVLAMWRQHPS